MKTVESNERGGLNDVVIKHIGFWELNGSVADQFHQNGKVYLLGDSCHSFPPAGGFGMNTGL